MITLNNHQIKAVFTDIDGVWTDGGMFYDSKGEAFKKFNTSDSAGVLFLRKLNIPLVVLTGEDSGATKSRMEKLKIEHVFYGVQDKLEKAELFCKKNGLDLATEVAYIGNDFNDWSLLNAVVHSAAPADAPEYIKKQVDVVLQKKGGEGVFREYIEFIIAKNLDLGEFVETFVSQ